MTQPSVSEFALWESTPTLDSPATDRAYRFGHLPFVLEESVYGFSARAATVRLVPFERTGQQECSSFDTRAGALARETATAYDQMKIYSEEEMKRMVAPLPPEEGYDNE